MDTQIFNSNNLNDFDQFFQENKENWSGIFILVDTNTHQHCLPALLNKIDFGESLEILEVDAGEDSKDIEIAAGLWLSLSELNADRKSLIINLGGGVVCDLGGWVASNYKRGIDFINIPTTVLAMVDAAIGGKTGIDLGGIKNLVGSFSKAIAMVNYPPFLDTLPEIEYFSGFAEMLKHSLIKDNSLWDRLKQLSPSDKESIQELINEAAEIKIKIVAEDFNELGLRKSLNYGHTIGHALEAISLENKEVITHGHAVAIGMVLVNVISNKLSFLSKENLDTINTYILSYYSVPGFLLEDLDNILKKMKKDKKNLGDKILMVLLQDIGEALIDIHVDEELIKDAISEIANNTFDS